MAVNQATFQVIENLLYEHTGQQLGQSRQWRAENALANITKKYDVEDIHQLAQRLSASQDAGLAQDIVEALVNNETYFFRDRPTFDQLPTQILPTLAKRRDQKRSLRIWSAGCSTGQEAHSLAMEIASRPKDWANWSISILGTDISRNAIATAKQATFSHFDVQRGLAITQLLKHFTEVASGWQLSPEIRKMTRFVEHNLHNEPPSREKFDLILCRNVLLYFDQTTRRQAFARLHEALAPDGFLMLGAGETVVGRTDKFIPSEKRPSIFEPAG